MPIFRTTEGTEITIKPVSMLLIGRIRETVEAELRGEGLSLTPPTYTVTTATGQVETFPLDAESAETDEQKAALAAYEAASARLENEQNRRTTKAMFRRGVKLDAIPAGWAAEMAAEGVAVSTDPAELKLEYIQMELLKTVADIQGAIMAITELSMMGASRGDLEAAQDSFRNRVEGTIPNGGRAEAA